MKYFVYCSNLKRSRLKERVGAWLSEENCIAEDYRLTFDSCGYAEIFQDKSSKVYDVIYRLSLQIKYNCKGLNGF